MNRQGKAAEPTRSCDESPEPKNPIGSLNGPQTSDQNAARTRDQFREAVERSPDFIAVISGGKYAYLNPAAARILRAAEPANVLGTPVLHFMSPDSAEDFRRRLEGLTLGQETAPSKETWLRMDGTGLEMEIRAALIPNGRNPRVLLIGREITARRQTDEAIREREERYRTLLETMEEGYYEVDLGGNFTFVNDSLCKIHGSPREELLGMNNRAYMSPETARKVYQIFRRIYETGRPVRSFEWEIVKKDGLRAVEESSVYLMRNPDGRPVGFRGILRDVTERKKMEETLRQSERGAQRLAREAAVLAEIGRIISSTLKIEEVYEQFAAKVSQLLPLDRISIHAFHPEQGLVRIVYVFGAEVEDRRAGDSYPLGPVVQEIIQNRKSLLVQTEDPGEVSRSYSQLLSTFHAGLHSMLSVPLISTDQVIGVMHIRSRKIEAYTENDVRLAERVGDQIAGAISNARLFAERQQAERALRESEEKYRLVVQNAHDAIFVAQDGGIPFSNAKTEELTGYSGAELAQIPIVQHIHPEDRESVVQRSSDRQSGKPVPGISFRIRNKSGREFWVELNGVDIMWRGRPAFLNFLRDITEQKALETQFLQSQKMEAIGRLAGGIAHDFNNLLTIVNTHAQLGLAEIKDWDPLRDKFDAIQKAGERAANLTRQLLAFSRRQRAEMKILDLNGILGDLEKMLNRILGEDIDLVSVLDPELGRVKADPGQIEQVLLNLVVNARDAMPSGGKLTIETKNVQLTEEYAYSHLGMEAGTYVMLSVSDNGVGMTPETRERIFEPFFTTKETGKGTGLGLSTVYGIVRQSRGNIWVYSEPGKGTTLKIYLPRVDAPVPESTPSSVKRDPAGGTETVLVVEDEEEVRTLAVAILRKHGYRVLEASHGEDALLVCEEWKQPIHLLLTDVVMPDIHGPDLARRLKYFVPEIRVVFMSGYTDNTILENGVLDRNMFFLQKPFSIQSLARIVREALDKQP
jgi:two-component system, cell cycle sensor histidine kinase and response regulator CckA